MQRLILSVALVLMVLFIAFPVCAQQDAVDPLVGEWSFSEIMEEETQGDVSCFELGRVMVTLRADNTFTFVGGRYFECEGGEPFAPWDRLISDKPDDLTMSFDGVYRHAPDLRVLTLIPDEQIKLLPMVMQYVYYSDSENPANDTLTLINERDPSPLVLHRIVYE